jgi:hypothetical protein
MRTLFRLLAVWLILAPLAYYFLLPFLTGQMQKQARAQIARECLTQTETQPDQFPPQQPAIAKTYCDCVAGGVVLSRRDIFTIARHQPPADLNQRVEAQVNQCNDRLQHPAPSDAQIMHF